jgi:hypothetical protein
MPSLVGEGALREMAPPPCGVDPRSVIRVAGAQQSAPILPLWRTMGGVGCPLHL